MAKGSAANTEERMTHTLVKWVYVGDVKSIDHFQIFLVADGGYELLGTIHADISSSNFSFRHSMDGDVVYETKYFYEVRAIGLDFKEGQKMKTPAVLKNMGLKISPQLLKSSRIIQR